MVLKAAMKDIKPSTTDNLHIDATPRKHLGGLLQLWYSPQPRGGLHHAE
jgi:hypothetical protein